MTLKGLTVMNEEIKLKERLTQLKKEQNLSSTEISKKIDVSKRAINQYLTGETRPDLINLIKLANLFNCSLDYLVGRDFEQTENSLL